MSRSSPGVIRMVVGALRHPIPPDPRLKRGRAVARANAGGMFDPCEDHLWERGTELVVDDVDVTPPAPGQFDDDALVQAVRLAAVEADVALVEEQDIEAWRVERATTAFYALGLDPDDNAVHDYAAELAGLDAAIDGGRGTPAVEERAFLLRRNLLAVRGAK